MGIFKTKKEEKKVVDTAVSSAENTKTTVKKVKTTKALKTKAIVAKGDEISLNCVIVRPRITEKATMMAENGVYVFEVTETSNESEIKRDFMKIYGKEPIRISVVRNPGKQIFRRGKVGYTAKVKKAYISLAKGEKIEIA